MGLVSRYIGYKWYVQLKDLLSVLCALLLCGGFSSICSRLFVLGLYLDGIIKIVVYIVLYLTRTFAFKPASFLNFKEIIEPLICRMRMIKIMEEDSSRH